MKRLNQVVGGGGARSSLKFGTCKRYKICYNGDMEHHNYKKAFTLAEVLITLGIVGVVAALVIPSIITNINNKGYVERLKKAQMVLQVATNEIISENGSIDIPDYIAMGYDAAATDEAMVNLVNLYASKMKVIHSCERAQWTADPPCVFATYLYKGLNNKGISGQWDNPFMFAYPMVLADGMTIAIRFAGNSGGAYLWGKTSMRFTVDVNGKAKPNRIGRDIFYLYLKNGSRIVPYGDGTDGVKDDCDTNQLGASCAYRIFKDGGMYY